MTIRIDNLAVDLGSFHLRDINLTLETGDFFALMGPTGAGKSVLLEALVGLVPIVGGDIFVDDRKITGLPPEKFFQAMGDAADILQCPLDLVDLDEKNLFTEYLKKKGKLKRVA